VLLKKRLFNLLFTVEKLSWDIRPAFRIGCAHCWATNALHVWSRATKCWALRTAGCKVRANRMLQIRGQTNLFVWKTGMFETIAGAVGKWYQCRSSSYKYLWSLKLVFFAGFTVPLFLATSRFWHAIIPGTQIAEKMTCYSFCRRVSIVATSENLNFRLVMSSLFVATMSITVTILSQ